MMLLGLNLRIKDFWACQISSEFNETEFTVLDIHPSKSHSRGILSVSGNYDLQKIQSFISSLHDIDRVEILLDEFDTRLLSFYFKHGPLGDLIFKTGMHIKPPLTLKNGLIHVKLIGTSESINAFLKETDTLSDVSLTITEKYELKSLDKPRLTHLQESALKEAIKFGYYDLPRRITGVQLAQKLDLSPSTVTEHLRKAENKIIKHYF